MTYKATSLNIKRGLSAGLIERKPLRPINHPVRCILVDPEVAKVLDGEDISLGFPVAASDALLGAFIAGHVLTVTQRGLSTPKKGRQVDLEKLENVDEVWALCLRKPPPGWRILGRFLEQNLFVGLKIYPRHELGTIAKYTQAASEIEKEWASYFGAIPPLRSSKMGDYLGEIFRDVDDE